SCVASRFPIAGRAVLDAADATHVQFVPSAPLAQGLNYAGFVDSAVIKSRAGHRMPSDFLTPFSTLDQEPPSAQIQQPAAGTALTANATITVTGIASDSVAIARAKFQLFHSDANGAMGPQVGADIPAAVINNDPCSPNRQVIARAQVQVPND